MKARSYAMPLRRNIVPPIVLESFRSAYYPSAPKKETLHDVQSLEIRKELKKINYGDAS